jgi:hypothetical protein
MTSVPSAPSPARALGWYVFAAAALLALRKPWALHTPQFWAEDAAVFLLQDQLLGAGAWLEPYNGYLHLLPRLVAWFASHTADVAWWPAIYNGCAFALHVALLLRLASRRVELPAKPGLLLAFPLVVGTGEPLLNMTNAQWGAAFFLLLQLFTARPTTHLQRVLDLGILALVGLNGPFAAVFAPLFAWRAWRYRHLDAWLALGVILACAAVQGSHVLRAGATLYGAAEPFRPFMGLSITGSRLVTWTFFGPAAVRAAPVWVHAVFGAGAIAALLVWSLRADPRRSLRAVLAAAFVLVTVACAYRLRADLWADDNLVNGDRYFYISRVLLAWLLILEWDATPRAVAWTARALCLAGIAFHVPHFVIPALPDYKWAAQCEPIRRGEATKLYLLPEGYWIDYPARPKSP